MPNGAKAGENGHNLIGYWWLSPPVKTRGGRWSFSEPIRELSGFYNSSFKQEGVNS